jgi:hypothetical protein
METKQFFIMFLIAGILLSFDSHGQKSQENDRFDKLSPAGLGSDWANRTIIDVVFDKETIVTNGSLDSMDKINMLNTIFPDQQYQRGKRFVDILLNGVMEGKFKTCDYLSGNPLTTEQASHICSHTDSVRVPIPDPPYEKDTIEKTEVNRDLIIKYRVMMDWYFDASKFSFKTKIIAIAPVLKLYDYSGNFRGNSPLFWVLYQ